MAKNGGVSSAVWSAWWSAIQSVHSPSSLVRPCCFAASALEAVITYSVPARFSCSVVCHSVAIASCSASCARSSFHISPQAVRMSSLSAVHVGMSTVVALPTVLSATVTMYVPSSSPATASRLRDHVKRALVRAHAGRCGLLACSQLNSASLVPLAGTLTA